MSIELAIANANAARVALLEATTGLEEAILRDSTARMRLVGAREEYEADEAEIIHELVYTADGKNAEQRKAQVDLGLIRARADGALSGKWAIYSEAQGWAEGTKANLDIATRRYRTAETIANLQAAILNALSL